jgi:hypothetical protein
MLRVYKCVLNCSSLADKIRTKTKGYYIPNAPAYYFLNLKE